MYGGHQLAATVVVGLCGSRKRPPGDERSRAECIRPAGENCAEPFLFARHQTCFNPPEMPAIDSGFCCELSVAEREPIVASAAADTRVWLVLEVPAPWPAKGYDEIELPVEVRAAITRWSTALDGVRVQLVRSEHRKHGATDLEFFVGFSGTEHCGVVKHTLGDLSELPEVDVPAVTEALRTGGEPPSGRRLSKPLILVCTHGKRDRCCAKWGLPIYRLAASDERCEVWQTTHLGGHRFAPTLLCLPQGVCYGRLEPQEVRPLLEATVRGEMFALDRLRGRTTLAPAQQAAEHFVRAHTGATELAALDVGEPRPLGPGSGQGDEAVFEVEVGRGAERFAVEVARRPMGGSAPGSCGKPPAPVVGWVLRTLQPV